MGLESMTSVLKARKMNKGNANKEFILRPDNKKNKYCTLIRKMCFN